MDVRDSSFLVEAASAHGKETDLVGAMCPWLIVINSGKKVFFFVIDT
jgi:hypothetical protein